MDKCIQMKSDIRKLIEYGMYDEAEQYIKLYSEQIGKDKEIEELSKTILYLKAPQISLICLDCEEEYIESVLAELEYSNLEVAKTNSGEDLFKDIYEYVLNTESKYVCFLEPNQRLTKDKLFTMMQTMENDKDIDALICQRCFESQGKKIADADRMYRGVFENQLFDGKKFLEYCVSNGVNLYGNLTTLMIKRNLVAYHLEGVEVKNELSDMYTVLLNYLLLYSINIAILESELVITQLEELNEEQLLKNSRQFQILLEYLKEKKEFTIQNYCKETMMPAYFRKNPTDLDIEKKITFFYTDKGEYYNLEPISKEAAKRGYEVRFTEEITEKAEIGVYCQHVCYPENSKFSLILLHDMAQGHNRWPDIWNIERWNKFDLGILPGAGWAERWAMCSSLYYTQPRCGAYLLGYPKSDYVEAVEITERAMELKSKMQLKYEHTVLYAPSWENDEKEDDFVRALASLKVNLLIKQASWPKEYAHIIKNIEDMRKLHEGKYENVHYIEPEENILVALKMCDLVVSDESSVMTEALMFGIPSIAVTDWLIPDTMPKRFASIPFDYVYKCKKVELREYVENIVLEQKKSNKGTELKNEYFYNAGHSCEDIMDAIEYYTGISKKEDVRFDKHFIKPTNMPITFWN